MTSPVPLNEDDIRFLMEVGYTREWAIKGLQASKVLRCLCCRVFNVLCVGCIGQQASGVRMDPGEQARHHAQARACSCPRAWPRCAREGHNNSSNRICNRNRGGIDQLRFARQFRAHRNAVAERAPSALAVAAGARW